MDELEILLRDGIVAEAFHAEKNLCIYKNVADEYEFINKQSVAQSILYEYIQTSAQDSFVLALSKLFDRPFRNYPNKCVEVFLNKVRERNAQMKPIVETSQLKNMLTSLNCPEFFIASINKSPSEFYHAFCDYFEEKYNNPTIQSSINTLRKFRDKAIAHNETKEVSINIQEIRALLDYAEQLYSIFGMAYSSTIFGDLYSLKHNAEMEAYFIKNTIERLKEVNSLMVQ